MSNEQNTAVLATISFWQQFHSGNYFILATILFWEQFHKVCLNAQFWPQRYEEFHSGTVRYGTVYLQNPGMPVGGGCTGLFRVGKILQVKINVTIDKNHGYKKIFRKFHLFDPPPGVWKFENPHYRVKNESCHKLYILCKNTDGYLGTGWTGLDGIYLRPLLRLEHLAVLKIKVVVNFIYGYQNLSGEKYKTNEKN